MNYKLLLGVRSFLFMADNNIIFYYKNLVIQLSLLLPSGTDEVKNRFTDHVQEIHVNHWPRFFFTFLFHYKFSLFIKIMLLPPIESYCYFTSMAKDLNSGRLRTNPACDQGGT